MTGKPAPDPDPGMPVLLLDRPSGADADLASFEIEYFPTRIGWFILIKRVIEKSGAPNSHSEVLCPDFGVVLLSSFRRKSESSPALNAGFLDTGVRRYDGKLGRCPRNLAFTQD